MEVQTEEGTTTDHKTIITTADENTTMDKTSSGDNTSFNLDVSDNPFITTSPPTESPPIPPTLPPIVVGYNPRKTGSYNLILDLMHNLTFGCWTQSLRKRVLKLKTE